MHVDLSLICSIFFIIVWRKKNVPLLNNDKHVKKKITIIYCRKHQIKLSLVVVKMTMLIVGKITKLLGINVF